MRIKAQAKINWTLDITGRREDGYHLMDMLMQPLALCDLLTLTEAPGLSMEVSGAALSCGEDNLVMKAARKMAEISGHPANLHIALEKHIPMGAGLGGGSADAAAVLKALNEYWHVGMTPDELCAVGLTLGVDVPFCVMDRPMRARGIGEVLTPISVGRCYPLLLIQPCEALSTKEVFAGYHQAPPRRPDTEACISALEKGDLSALKRFSGNVLEPVSCEKRPVLTEAKERLYQAGASFAQMTGSGSVVFGAFEQEKTAQTALMKLKDAYPVCLLTHTAASSPIE